MDMLLRRGSSADQRHDCTRIGAGIASDGRIDTRVSGDVASLSQSSSELC
jgi:hypothetical protein